MNDLIDFKNPSQIINMGGPWVADLLSKKVLVSKNIIIDNFILNSAQEDGYFIKYNYISKWGSKNFFTLININFKASLIKEFHTKFDMIFIIKISNGVLVYNNTFHNEDVLELREIDLNKETYTITNYNI